MEDQQCTIEASASSQYRYNTYMTDTTSYATGSQNVSLLSQVMSLFDEVDVYYRLVQCTFKLD